MHWPEVSDFVARFARCSSPKTHGHARIARRIAREMRAILACPCVFGLAQREKKCDTNHIPRDISRFSPRIDRILPGEALDPFFGEKDEGFSEFCST